VYVTHDQLEALTVADYMAIMNEDGQVEQVGTPMEIYEFPITVFVAQFVGTTNILYGTVIQQDNIYFLDITKVGRFVLPMPKEQDWQIEGTQLVMSIRPEKIEVSLRKLDTYQNYMKGTIEAIIYHGRSTQYNVRVLPDLMMRVFRQNEEHSTRDVVTYDDIVYLHWNSDSVVLFKE
jgi:spermidine/putrescine transport system ATP-binding protein